MTDFLVKKFVPNYTSTESVEVRTAYGRLSGIVGIICNVIMFVFKLAAGFISGSISITADAFNNLSDASSSIISLIGFKLASMPPDREHPYGHGRYEYLSGLVVSALVIAIGIELFTTGVRKIITPEAVEFGVLPAVVLILSALLTAGYLLPVVTEGFFPGRDFITERREVGVQMTWPMIAFAAAVVLMGLLPGGLLHWLGLLAARLFP